MSSASMLTTWSPSPVTNIEQTLIDSRQEYMRHCARRPLCVHPQCNRRTPHKMRISDPGKQLNSRACWSVDACRASYHRSRLTSACGLHVNSVATIAARRTASSSMLSFDLRTDAGARPGCVVSQRVCSKAEILTQLNSLDGKSDSIVECRP
jgi:hypothetical protein